MRCPTRSTSSRTCAGSRTLLIAVCADLGLATTRVEGRSGVWVAGRRPRAGPQGRRDRHPRRPRASRCTASRSTATATSRCVRPDRAVRHHRRRVTLADRRARPARVDGAPTRSDAVRRQRRRRAVLARASRAARRRLDRVTDRPRGPQAAAAGGPQRRDPDRAQAAVDQDPRCAWGRSTPTLKSLVKREGLHTVCQEAGCPNIYECWEDREATFLIGGDQCTRRCDFCQIDTGKPQPLDRDEPRRVAESVQTMGLRYATVTGVARDDLPDGGAWLYAETVRADPRAQPRHRRRAAHPRLQRPSPTCSPRSSTSRPEVLAHNVETVPRIFKRIRPGLPLRPLARRASPQARAAGLVTKSNLILGHGRDHRRGRRGAARPARRRLRPDHDHPVPAAVRRATTRSSAGCARRSSSTWRHRPSDRVRRRAQRAARPLLLPRRSALRARRSRRARHVRPRRAERPWPIGSTPR